METSSTIEQGGVTPSFAAGDGAGRERLLEDARIRKAKLLFVLAAGISFLFSVYLWFLVDRDQGLFVGLWVPSILSLGAVLLSGRGGAR